MSTLQKVVMLYQVMEGSILIVCDDLSALQQVQSRNLTDPNVAHYDLIRAIQLLQKELPIQLKFEHVKGHTDFGIPTALTILASMNAEMDAVAKRMIDKEAVGPKRYKIPGELWCCYVEGQWLTQQVAAHLRVHINRITIEAHWDKKVHYKTGHKSMIDYKMAGWALVAPTSQYTAGVLVVAGITRKLCQ